MSQDFGGSVSVSAIAREKTSEMSYWGTGKCLHFCNFCNKGTPIHKRARMRAGNFENDPYKIIKGT